MTKEMELKKIFLQLRGFLETPPLWNDEKNFDFPQYDLGEVELSDPLPPLHLPDRLVLGKRMEHFFEYCIRHFTDREILAANEQIIAEKQTLGELDFLIKSPSGYIEHVELVYKFYVYDPSFTNEKDRWIGPNRRDTLLKKLNRLEGQQFPLLYKKETRALLEQLNIDPAAIKQKVCFKANLFVPKALLNLKFPLINNKCVAGFWIHQSQFIESEFGSNLFYSPKKQDWPIAPENGKIWFTFTEIKEQLLVLLKEERSPLVWMKTPKDEYYRFFLVWW